MPLQFGYMCVRVQTLASYLFLYIHACFCCMVVPFPHKVSMSIPMCMTGNHFSATKHGALIEWLLNQK